MVVIGVFYKIPTQGKILERTQKTGFRASIRPLLRIFYKAQ